MADSGRPLQWEIRETIKRLIKSGFSIRKAAKETGTSVNTVQKYAGAKKDEQKRQAKT